MLRLVRQMRLSSSTVAIAVVVTAGVTLAALSCVRAQEDYQAQREAMVDALVAREVISDARVIAAMKAVQRHLYVPEGQRPMAYLDTPLPIGYQQTISAPSIVGMMTQALKPKETDKVLEIGTGSGYQAAVLAKLVKHVYTIEIVEPLAASAKQRLTELGYKNVTVKAGDGYLGWAEHAPFDSVIVTCAPTKVPDPLVQQLREGGLMVIPVEEEDGRQVLYLIEKTAAGLEKIDLADVIFVPMTGIIQEEEE